MFIMLQIWVQSYTKKAKNTNPRKKFFILEDIYTYFFINRQGRTRGKEIGAQNLFLFFCSNKGTGIHKERTRHRPPGQDTQKARLQDFLK